MRRCLQALTGTLLLLLPVPTLAQQRGATPKANATATLVSPVTVITRNNMDFGYLSVSAAGTATIDPNTGALTTSGGVRSAGGTPRPASFVAGTAGITLVIIRVPTSAVILRRFGGTESITATNFTLQGSAIRLIFGTTGVTFNVGAQLNVSAGQAEGLYTGTFDVLLDYY